MGRTCFWVVNERPDRIEALSEDLAVSPTGSCRQADKVTSLWMNGGKE
jgi:hypothetical protein